MMYAKTIPGSDKRDEIISIKGIPGSEMKYDIISIKEIPGSERKDDMISTERIPGSDGRFSLQGIAVTVTVGSNNSKLVLVIFLQLRYCTLASLNFSDHLPSSFTNITLLHTIPTVTSYIIYLIIYNISPIFLY